MNDSHNDNHGSEKIYFFDKIRVWKNVCSVWIEKRIFALYQSTYFALLKVLWTFIYTNYGR